MWARCDATVFSIMTRDIYTILAVTSWSGSLSTGGYVRPCLRDFGSGMEMRLGIAGGEVIPGSVTTQITGTKQQHGSEIAVGQRIHAKLEYGLPRSSTYHCLSLHHTCFLLKEDK